jgi:hypothetical protein
MDLNDNSQLIIDFNREPRGDNDTDQLHFERHINDPEDCRARPMLVFAY